MVPNLNPFSDTYQCFLLLLPDTRSRHAREGVDTSRSHSSQHFSQASRTWPAILSLTPLNSLLSSSLPSSCPPLFAPLPPLFAPVLPLPSSCLGCLSCQDSSQYEGARGVCQPQGLQVHLVRQPAIYRVTFSRLGCSKRRVALTSSPTLLLLLPGSASCSQGEHT